MVQFVGKYKLVKSENFDEYLKAKAIKMASALTPYLEVDKNDDEWCLKVYTLIKTIIDMKFKPDVEFYHTRMDGTKCKVVIHFEEDAIVEEETPCDHPEDCQTNVRHWIDDDHVVLILKCKNVEARRYFERC